MPLYLYECDGCGRRLEEARPVDSRDLEAMHNCGGVIRRVFTPTAMIQVPEHFKRLRGWHLPPKDSPAWAHMQPEGTTRQKTPERPTLEDEFKKAGLL